MLALLLPTLRARAADAVLLRLRVPGPVMPPKVAEARDPKLKIPLPLVSSVLFCKARGLPSASMPRLTVVAPEYVLSPLRVNIPAPFLMSPPVPARIEPIAPEVALTVMVGVVVPAKVSTLPVRV